MNVVLCGCVCIELSILLNFHSIYHWDKMRKGKKHALQPQFAKGDSNISRQKVLTSASKLAVKLTKVFGTSNGVCLDVMSQVLFQHCRRNTTMTNMLYTKSMKFSNSSFNDSLELVCQYESLSICTKRYGGKGCCEHS